MTVAANVVNLEQFKKYCKDTKYDAFVEDFRSSFRDGSAISLAGNDILGGVVDPETAREMLYQGLRDKILQRPETLAEIVKTLESE